MTKSVLITGAAGFLGSHLCDDYLDNGYKVLGLDNLSTGAMKNIKHLESNSNFKFYECDIVQKIPEEVASVNYDIILNLASPASPPHYQRLSIETLRVNSEGTLQMLDLAKRHKARLFHASTSEVYGDPEVHPQTESYKGSVNCYGPRSMYDEGKRYAEALIYSHRKKHETNTCVGRFFNTYGPRMDPQDGRVVSNFIVQALSGQHMTVYGDGGQTRSFCYVDDLVKAIVLLVDSNESDPMNLGNPDEFTIKELADIVLSKTNSESELTYLPLPGDDPLQRRPDIASALEKLGWKPEVKLVDGLDPTIEYFRGVLG